MAGKMADRPLLSVILGAGKGTRMKSDIPKVLHAVAGRSMLGHVLALAHQVDGSSGASSLAVVIGPGMDNVRAEAQRQAPGTAVFIQETQQGTADAVLAAKPSLERFAASGGDVIVLYADTPLLTAATIARLRAELANGAHVAVLGFEPADPSGYGRLLTDAAGNLLAIREDKEATPAERAVRLCNSGVMGFRSEHLIAILSAIGKANAKGEYYLTDAVEIARTRGLKTAVVTCPEDEVLGVNSRGQLAEAEAIYQRRARARLMADGATLIDPGTVYVSFDTIVGRDVVIEPNVFFGPGVVIEDGAEIKANCHIEGARVGKGARIGPFARLRPGADLAEDVHIGNFVEVKKVKVEKGAKANHLAYLGDGRVGAGANIGAGTIFCNYDGFNKHHTDVGAGAFVGSNSSLVAPVKIGDGAYIGSGSVITRNVTGGALALERNKQEERPGWAAKFREMMSKRTRKTAE
jgi:bifunctional UDP-N-acetylglucosamine pyrophosphorylase / glucosamine-1-phosphate N-acetyltransferase